MATPQFPAEERPGIPADAGAMNELKNREAAKAYRLAEEPRRPPRSRRPPLTARP